MDPENQRSRWVQDEYDVDFSDNRAFVAQRWKDAIAAVKQNLSSADFSIISEPKDWVFCYQNLQKQALAREGPESDANALRQIFHFPRALHTLISLFAKDLEPFGVDSNALWGLFDLNVTLSSRSSNRLKQTVLWTKKLRNMIELFNRCLENCEDMNEARYSIVDMLECLLHVFTDSIKYLRQNITEADASKAWKALQGRIDENLNEMEGFIKHLNDIVSYSKANVDKQVTSLTRRLALANEPEENAAFPILLIPRKPNENFYGREEGLDRISKFLDFRTNKTLRTYTIYGRRGVGKTNIALEYAERNPVGFDAIFWVSCETNLALRQSFSDIAVELGIPGADKYDHHEENQMNVLKWLKLTRKAWLLIFDNAEDEAVLRGYWPLGAVGTILITSRGYFNFTNDAMQKGETIKPFTEAQSWELLIKLLGPEWQEQDRKSEIKQSEVTAAKALLKEFGGLALAIQQVAGLIRNEDTGDKTIAATYESFKMHKLTLPERPDVNRRSSIIHSLDALWSMKFVHLTKNSHDLLSVLALLSPDGILIDLFLPRNQKALDGKLAKFKNQLNTADPNAPTILSSIVVPSNLLADAIKQLLQFDLITQFGRELQVHRVVQEAMNYQNFEDLQISFDSACALVYEAFPKKISSDWISDQFGTCAVYISHGARLSRHFQHYHIPGKKNSLAGSQNFIDLMANCGQYLMEIGDYETSLRLVQSGQIACGDNTDTLSYATLCMTAGAVYYEQNKLAECRKSWENFHMIQEKLLNENDLERSSSLHNMGILEATCDNLVKATEYFDCAIRIRTAAGDPATKLLANSYLCYSRVLFAKGELDKGFQLINRAEAIFFRVADRNDPFMAHIHYAYGNIEYQKKNWQAALLAYKTCLKIALTHTPIHPITASAYYSLGCVEYELKHNEVAIGWLDKAIRIAELKSPHGDDGMIARIMWKKSVVLESDMYGTFQTTAKELRMRAEMARKKLAGSGEGGIVIALDEDGNPDAAETEASYDVLVPGYFR